jgi:hypothetical protein
MKTSTTALIGTMPKARRLVADGLKADVKPALLVAVQTTEECG